MSRHTSSDPEFQSTERAEAEAASPYVRRMESEDAAEVCRLVLDAFWKFNAEEYGENAPRFTEHATPEVMAEFAHSALALVAVDEDRIVGMLVIIERSHIELLFVDESYHRRGVATLMWRQAVRALHREGGLPHEITVNASRYGTPFYREMGFTPVSGVIGSHGQEINRMVWTWR